MDTEYTYEYIARRGVTKETMAFFDAKTKVDREGKPVSIGYKYPTGWYKVRKLDKKEFYSEGDTKPGLYGRDKFAAGSHKYLTITEGEEDAHSLHQVLRSPVCSVQSSSSAARDCTVDRDYIRSFERVYLAFDNDEAGREARRNVAKLLDYNSTYVVNFSNRKDANEYLQHGEADELRNIWWNSKKYLPETVISSLDEFKKILQEPQERGIPYPFGTLNEMTHGIRLGESVLITAQEGIGKTELMHAIEHKILKENPDVNVGAIFLEQPKKRHLQALAGIEIGRPVHLPESGCSDAEVTAALEKVVLRDDRLHVYNHFGSDDPDVLLDTIRFLVGARSCSYILLDHISMACAGLAGEADERRALDYLSNRLEMMVKELNFALIVVSHVNDLGQTRGSRMIGKVADIRIALERDFINPDPVIQNTIKLIITKPSRYSGKSGPAGVYLFDPFTRQYTERRDGYQAETKQDSSGDTGVVS